MKRRSSPPEARDLAGDPAVEKINHIATSTRICLFGTSEGHTPLEFRPMSVQHVDAVGNLWFLSARSSTLNRQVSRHPFVQLLFANPAASEYLSLQGRAFASDSQPLREKYWNPLAQAWFKQGINDPELTVVHVQPEQGHYWDSDDGKTVTFLKIAVAALTGADLPTGVSGEVRP